MRQFLFSTLFSTSAVYRDKGQRGAKVAGAPSPFQCDKTLCYNPLPRGQPNWLTSMGLSGS